MYFMHIFTLQYNRWKTAKNIEVWGQSKCERAFGLRGLRVDRCREQREARVKKADVQSEAAR